MTITNPSNLYPIGTISTFADVNNALTAITANLAKLNTFGLGTQSPLFTPIHPTSSATIDVVANSQIQAIGVRSSIGALTITLPSYSALIVGSMFYIYDETSNATTYNITIARNGNDINGSASDKTINTNNGFILLYCGVVGLTKAEFFIFGSSGVV